MDVSAEVYALFEQDRQAQAALGKFKAEVTRLFNLPDEYYDGPDGSPRGQRFRDYQIVYRNRVSPDTVKDPNYYKTALLWPEPKNWRRACAWRRRREI